MEEFYIVHSYATQIQNVVCAFLDHTVLSFAVENSRNSRWSMVFQNLRVYLQYQAYVHTTFYLLAWKWIDQKFVVEWEYLLWYVLYLHMLHFYFVEQYSTTDLRCSKVTGVETVTAPPNFKYIKSCYNAWCRWLENLDVYQYGTIGREYTLTRDYIGYNERSNLIIHSVSSPHLTSWICFIAWWHNVDILIEDNPKYWNQH